MTFRQRLNAVLHRQLPDGVPFAPYDNLMPQGDFERELRNRGMGLLARRGCIRSETPNVTVKSSQSNDGSLRKQSYRTPVGTVFTETRVKHERRDVGSLQCSWLIKRPEDFAPAIFIIDHTVFYPQSENYHDTARDLGDDGLVRADGVSAPYDQSVDYFGLENWVYSKEDYPEGFARLLEALERRTERALPLVLSSPAEFVACGSLSGNYSPGDFQKYVLPFYQRYIPRLAGALKITSYHAHASNLASYRELIPALGVNVVEAFTPPPIGNLSLAEARQSWGESLVLWVNFPETIFYQGPKATEDYTRQLLQEDSAPGRLVMGLTEMGAHGIVDSETEHIFKAGLRAVMEALERWGRFSP